MVRQAVQDHYDQEISHKHAIHVRQVRRQQAQAERHIEELAEKRKAEMLAMSETARQQSLLLPSDSDAGSGDAADEQQQEPDPPVVDGADRVVLEVHDGACEIVPAAGPSSSNSRQRSSDARANSSSRKVYQRRVAFADLNEPLLSRTADDDETWERDQPGYTAPATEQQQQQPPVPFAVYPINSRSLVQSGSDLLLQRYLGSSHLLSVKETDAAATRQQPAGVNNSQERPDSVSSTASWNNNVVSSSYGTADYSSITIGRRGSVGSNAAASTPRDSPASTPKKGIAVASAAVAAGGGSDDYRRSKVQYAQHGHTATAVQGTASG